jgi:hypothetical protein
MPLREKSNGLLRTDGANWKHCQRMLFGRARWSPLLRGLHHCPSTSGGGRKILRVEEIGKRLDDLGDYTRGVINWS